MDILSIDFGTSYCAAAYFDVATHPTPVVFGTNQFNGDCYKTPTVIQYALTPDGEEIKIIGEVALSNLIQSNNSNSAIISKIKTELHERNGYIINGKPKQSVDIVSDILSYIKNVSEKQAGVAFEKVLITHPAQYELARKEILHGAAIKAGFSEVFFVEEPIAAAYSFIEKHNIDKEKGALVFDYGGGTIDVAYLWYDLNGKIQFKFEPEGKSQCGGEYIDLLFHNQISKIIDGQVSTHISPLLLDLCTRTKVNFTKSTQENIAFKNRALPIDRDEFESIIYPKVSIALSTLDSVVQKCQLNKFPIDYVFLNGGSSRLHVIIDSIKKMLPDSVIVPYEGDDLAVALGGIIYYYSINSDVQTNSQQKNPGSVTVKNSRFQAIRENYNKQFNK